MRTSLAILLAATFLLTSCVRFSPRDICPRRGDVSDWITATTRRINTINTDSNLDSRDLGQLYLDQKAQPTPACLSAAQDHALTSFLRQWEAAKAIEQDNIIGSLLPLVQSRIASSQTSTEVDRLAELNGW